MLILTRKTDQTIQIGEEIEIQVLEINGDQVKLGVQAPKQIEIHRKEVYAAIQEENSKAAETSAELLTQLNQQIQESSESKRLENHKK